MATAQLLFGDLGPDGSTIKVGPNNVFVVLDSAATDQDTTSRLGEAVRIRALDADIYVYFGAADPTLTTANAITLLNGEVECFYIEDDTARIKIAAV